MIFNVRTAGFAVFSCCALAMVAPSAPSFATDAIFAPAIPPVIVAPAAAAPAPEATDEATADDAAAAPVEPAATSLSQLVARYDDGAALDDEAECLAGAVYFEAKGEPLDGQLAVAQVIINRAGSGRFPKSLCSVVFQRGQFSFVRGGSFPYIARTGRAWREASAIARIAQQCLWDSSAAKALFFHARRVSPGWKLTRVAAVGNHIFYR